MSGTVRTDVHIVARPLTHPDAARLVEEVQQEYLHRYGGRDDTPLDGTEFDPGNGAFYVGYCGDEPVVSGAWRWLPPPAGIPWPAAVVLETGLGQPETIGLYTSSGYQPVPKYGHYACVAGSRCYGKAL